MRARTVVITLVIAFAISVLVFIANIGIWAQRQVLEPGALSVATLEALHEDDSEQAIARFLMDEAIEEVELLRAVRIPGEQAIGVVLASGVLDETYIEVTDLVRERIVTGDGEAVVIDLLDLKETILGPIADLAPGLVDLIPDSVFRDIVIIESGALPSLRFAAEMTPLATAGAAAAAVFLAVLLLAFSRRRAFALLAIAGAVAAAGGWTLVWIEAGRPQLIGRIDDELAVVLAGNAYDVLVRSLREQSMLVIFAGIIIAAMALLWYLGEQLSRSGDR